MNFMVNCDQVSVGPFHNEVPNLEVSQSLWVSGRTHAVSTY